jgi:hypothetical protein
MNIMPGGEHMAMPTINVAPPIQTLAIPIMRPTICVPYTCRSERAFTNKTEKWLLERAALEI